PACATGSKYFAGRSTIRCTSMAPPPLWTIGEIDCSTIGPIVTGSTKCPSPTSKWKMRQPAARSVSICSPRREKSAPYSDGSTSAPRIQSFHMASSIAQARDEEAGGAVPVGPREQELGPRRVLVLRPLAAERLDLEAGRIDDGLVLVRVEGAHGVDDRAAGLRPLRRRADQLQLQLGERLGAPAQIGSAGQHAEARARRVDERAVEALLGELAHVGVDDAHVRRHLLGKPSRAPGVDLDRCHVAAQEERLATGRGA